MILMTHTNTEYGTEAIISETDPATLMSLTRPYRVEFRDTEADETFNVSYYRDLATAVIAAVEFVNGIAITAGPASMVVGGIPA